MLSVEKLNVKVNDSNVLRNLSLEVNDGEVHVIMGPNGAGKSTFAHVLAGKPDYEVESGNVLFNGEDLLSMNIEQRALSGLFLCFQSPVEIVGVSVMSFLKASVNSVRKHREEPELDSAEFLKVVREASEKLGIDQKLLKRSVNSGFSGGEKKLFEALQILLLSPSFIILDEADSGLDVDALMRFGKTMNSLRSNSNSWLIITHHFKLLEYIIPDKVHIVSEGAIVKSGGSELADEISRSGYFDCL